MMLDADVVAASPSSVYRVLKTEELLGRGAAAPSAKGTGFVPPTKPHAHWHIDVSYINIAGTFYYLCAVLDGYSRFIVHWEIRAQMQEQDIEIILQRARERVPEARPRIISDNGPQFIAKDFKVFIRLMGMTHVRTSPFYPQSNGKLERWHQSLKRECIRPNSPVSLDDTRRLVETYVRAYNEVRLHSAIGYIAPRDQLLGHAQRIHANRQEQLAAAAAQRATAHQDAPMRWPRECHPPICDGRGRPPLLVTPDLGARGGQGGVPRNEGSSLMAPSHKVSSSPGGVVGTAIRPRSVGTLPTNSGRAKFRFLLNQDSRAHRQTQVATVWP
jgi:transposase InsO family protein